MLKQKKCDKKAKLVYGLFVTLIYLFVFQELIQKYIPFFQYLDEVFAFLAIPLIILKGKKFLADMTHQKKKMFAKIFWIYLGLTLIGGISSIIFKYQSFKASLVGLVVFVKFPLALLSSFLLFDSETIKQNSKKIHVHINIISVILLSLTILNYTQGIFHATYRSGLLANQLFFSHPAKLAMISIFLTILNVLTSKKKMDLTTIILIIISCSTLRAKAIGFCFAMVLINYYVCKTHKKISFSKLGVIGILAAVLIFDQISVYYVNNTESPRYLLAEKSIEIANDHFPLGSGFSTFGSNASARYYSPLYKQYGLSNIYGFSKLNPSYISDTFWPMVLAELGYAGLILYIIFVVLIFRRIQNVDIRSNEKLYTAQLLCLVYLLISSTSESAFVNPMAVMLAMIIGLNVKEWRSQ